MGGEGCARCINSNSKGVFSALHLVYCWQESRPRKQEPRLQQRESRSQKHESRSQKKQESISQRQESKSLEAAVQIEKTAVHI